MGKLWAILVGMAASSTPIEMALSRIARSPIAQPKQLVSYNRKDGP